MIHGQYFGAIIKEYMRFDQVMIKEIRMLKILALFVMLRFNHGIYSCCIVQGAIPSIVNTKKQGFGEIKISIKEIILFL